MVNGTAVAIYLGNAMEKELVRLKAPQDLVADLRDMTDKLIVHCVQRGSGKTDRNDLGLLCDALAQVFSTAAGVGWEQGMRSLGVDYGHDE